jgi:hypothetical protein
MKLPPSLGDRHANPERETEAKVGPPGLALRSRFSTTVILSSRTVSCPEVADAARPFVVVGLTEEVSWATSLPRSRMLRSQRSR